MEQHCGPCLSVFIFVSKVVLGDWVGTIHLRLICKRKSLLMNKLSIDVILAPALLNFEHIKRSTHHRITRDVFRVQSNIEDGAFCGKS